MLFLCHRWLERVSRIYSAWRPDYQQDVHDKGRGRKYKIKTLSGKATSQDFVLLQVNRNAEILHSFATSLP